MDKNGIIWVKSGADKRKATSREEVQRMYQHAGLIHGDEVPIAHSSSADIDLIRFADFYVCRSHRDYQPRAFAQ